MMQPAVPLVLAPRWCSSAARAVWCVSARRVVCVCTPTCVLMRCGAEAGLVGAGAVPPPHPTSSTSPSPPSPLLLAPSLQMQWFVCNGAGGVVPKKREKKSHRLPAADRSAASAGARTGSGYKISQASFIYPHSLKTRKIIAASLGHVDRAVSVFSPFLLFNSISCYAVLCS